MPEAPGRRRCRGGADYNRGVNLRGTVPSMSGRVFRRSASPNPPVAVAAHGSTIVDADGPRVPRRRRRRDRRQRRSRPARDRRGAGGAGRAASRTPTAVAFTTEPLERYAAEVGAAPAGRRPGDLPGLAAGPRRSRRRSSSPARRSSPAASRTASSCSRGGGATTATRSGRWTCRGASRSAARTRAWLGRFRHVSAAYPYRGGEPGSQALGTTPELAAELEAAIPTAGPGPWPRSSRSRSSGATLGAVEPPDGYWPAIADVCRRHGVLLIADEVMTGFGRTGAWFGMDHYGVRPDILVAAKGATSGYWPFGFVAASGEVLRRASRRPAASSTGSPTRTSRARRPSPARCCGSSRRSRSSRRPRPRASGSLALLPGPAGRPPGRRRHPRPRPDGGRGARPRPRDPRGRGRGRRG